jgi:hypothetical protein
MQRLQSSCYDEPGMPQPARPDTILLRKWMEAWRHADGELARLRRTELQSVDTREAVRQIFGKNTPASLPAAPPTSGLVEQQAWFARLRLQPRNP